MLKYKIVLAPFPFGEQNTRKTRPVLCLTDEIGKFEEVVVAFITSQTPDPLLKSDIKLLANSETGLKKESVARLHKVFTLPKSQILGKLGEVSKSNQKKIQKSILELLSGV